MTTAFPSRAAVTPEFLLDEATVRRMIRVVSDAAGTEGGVPAQKAALMNGLCALVDADLWMWNVTRMEPGEQPVAVSMVHNLSERQLALVMEEQYIKGVPAFHEAMDGQFMRPGHWTRRIEDFMDLGEVERQGMRFRSNEELGMGQSLFSSQRVPGQEDLYSAIGLHRSVGRGPFEAEEVRIAHIVMSECGWLHASGAPQEDGRAVQPLSPRLRTVLGLLMDGQAVKRIAYHLELSEHTVRGYVQDIYRHFGVSGRAELMRRFMVGDGRDLA
ncbi:MAG: helix-turn-helix transcriptional regulator [Planctomycetota bacterium]